MHFFAPTNPISHHSNVHKKQKQIACLLLAVFLVGAVVTPLFDAFSHAAEKEDDHELNHEHPDYLAFLDANQHIVDTHLDCILCNQTLVVSMLLRVSWRGVAGISTSFQHWEQRTSSYLTTTRFIRGPPGTYYA